MMTSHLGMLEETSGHLDMLEETSGHLGMLEETSGAPLWLVTFADLTAILVALFVLIFSMSTPFSDKGAGMQSGAEVETNRSAPGNAGDLFGQRNEALADLTIGYLSAVFSDRGIARVDMVGAVGFTPDRPVSHVVEGDRLILRLDPSFFFVAGERDMRSTALDQVAIVTDVLSNVANPVSIISPVLSNDWTLAFDRADAMVEAFRRTGYGAPVERFVSPGLSGGALMVVVARSDGGRS